MILCGIAGNAAPGEYDRNLSYSYFAAIAAAAICFIVFNRLIKNKVIDILLLVVSSVYIAIHLVFLYQWNALYAFQTIIWGTKTEQKFTAQIFIDIVAVIVLILKMLRYKTAGSSEQTSTANAACASPESDTGSNKEENPVSRSVVSLTQDATESSKQELHNSNQHTQTQKSAVVHYKPLIAVLSCVMIVLAGLCLYFYNKYYERNQDYNTEISLYNDAANKYSDLKDQYDSLSDDYTDLNDKYESLQKDYDSLNESSSSDEETYDAGYNWGLEIGYRFGYYDGANGNDALY